MGICYNIYLLHEKSGKALACHMPCAPRTGCQFIQLQVPLSVWKSLFACMRVYETQGDAKYVRSTHENMCVYMHTYMHMHFVHDRRHTTLD
jgi:hypothetical protein